MLIGGDDISNVVITLGTRFLTFVYIRADWRTSDSSVDGELQGNWRWNSNPRDVVASSPSFSRPATGAPRRACSQARDGVIFKIIIIKNRTIGLLWHTRKRQK